MYRKWKIYVTNTPHSHGTHPPEYRKKRIKLTHTHFQLTKMMRTVRRQPIDALRRHTNCVQHTRHKQHKKALSIFPHKTHNHITHQGRRRLCAQRKRHHTQLFANTRLVENREWVENVDNNSGGRAAVPELNENKMIYCECESVRETTTTRTETTLFAYHIYPSRKLGVVCCLCVLCNLVTWHPVRRRSVVKVQTHGSTARWWCTRPAWIVESVPCTQLENERETTRARSPMNSHRRRRRRRQWAAASSSSNVEHIRTVLCCTVLMLCTV